MADETEKTPEAETTDENAGENAGEAEAESTPPKPTGPFELLPGARVEYGTRKGKVVEVRGNGDEPYDVQIRWEGAKYPEWFLYAALRTAWQQGEFRVTRQGRWTILHKLMGSAS